MNLMHIAKAALGVTIFFLGFQFGRDIATKVSTMSTTSTPATA
jgi:hypothetical protein